jgi:hypothetical protein
MRTFVYTGPAKTLRVRDVELSHGQPFSTDDHRLIGVLSVLVDVEEVAEKKEEPKKPSRKTDAVQS